MVNAPARERMRSMSDARSLLKEMKLSQAEHLPLVAAFLERMGLVARINAAVPSEMAVDLGSVVKLLVLDTLCGRSPLYRLERFAASVDTGLLLGREVSPSAFNDTTLGRALDALYERGTEQLFSQIAYAATLAFPLEVDRRHLHFDTTSVSVWGEYATREDAGPQELNITHGYSKDLRPDLKQFLVQMLCCHRNIPVLGGCADGNASDKTINNAVLTNLSKYLARHGLAPGAFVYIADAAMVTPQNLAALGENLFITRLPFTYGEAERVVSEAVKAGTWAAAEQEADSSAGRKKAAYRVQEAAVTLEGRGLRAVVVHSDAFDRRRQKKIERLLSESRTKATGMLEEAAKVGYFCREDAEDAAEKLRDDRSRYHFCECAVTEKITYARGRPPKNGERKVAKMRYVIEGRPVERADEVERAKEAAGCFVLLTNVPTEGEMAHTPFEVLAAYKEQHGIERNFGFLKDPLIVNDIFLKRPDRIEVLGFILLLSLLTWNLMEHVMRARLKKTDSTISGWDRKPTTKPTTFMMTTKFKGVLVAKIAGEWYFTAPLTQEQQQYVRALGLSEEDLLGKGTAPLCPPQKLLGERL
jgi:transposase